MANPAGNPDFFLVAKEESARWPTRNVHFGFKAPDRETMDEFHPAALCVIPRFVAELGLT